MKRLIGVQFLGQSAHNRFRWKVLLCSTTLGALSAALHGIPLQKPVLFPNPTKTLCIYLMTPTTNSRLVLSAHTISPPLNQPLNQPCISHDLNNSGLIFSTFPAYATLITCTLASSATKTLSIYRLTPTTTADWSSICFTLVPS